jgi:imidazolonepropionase-like amidohydrolase
MPTIVDLHTHFRGTREDYVDGLHREAYFGVGAVMSIGSEAGLSADLRANPIPGAALYRDGGRGLRGPGRTGMPVTTESEARKAVQVHAEQRVDMIKIYVDPGTSDKDPTLTPPLYGAIIDEANKLGYRVVAHMRFLRDGKGLLRAGLHGFLHVVRDMEIDDEFVSLIKQRRDVFVAPNLPPRGVMPDLSFVKDIYPPAAFEDLMKEVTDSDSPLAFAKERPLERFAIQAASLRRLKAEGVTIGFGTDSSVGFGVHIEMEDMVVAGMTPAEVIVAATKTSAELLRLTDHGTVAAGKIASFIVLDANPLDQITNTRRISDVYLRGTKVDRTGLKVRWTADKAWRRHENS